MAEDLIGLDILPRMTVMRPDSGLRFFLGPLLHTTLVNDIREKSKLKLKSVLTIPPHPSKNRVFLLKH